jgi:hypothetical protein
MKNTQSKWQRWIGAYKAINSHRYERLKDSKKESFFDKYFHVNKKQTANPCKRFFTGLLWMAVPVLLILGALYGCISYMAAILAVILYHFIAMHIVIMMGGYLNK